MATTGGYRGSAQKGRRTARAGGKADNSSEWSGWRDPGLEGTREDRESLSVSTVRRGLTSQMEFSGDAAQT